MLDDDTPLLDVLQVADLIGLDQGRGRLFGGFVHVFLATSGDRMARLRKHAQAAESVGLATLAHALIGSASNVGAARLAELFRQIEKAAKAGDLAAARVLLGQLDVEYAAAQDALLAAVSNNPANNPANNPGKTPG